MIHYLSKVKLPHCPPTITESSLDQVIEVVEELSTAGWDTETTGLTPMYDKPILDILGDYNNQVVIDLRTIPVEDIERIHLAAKDKQWLAHNAKFDYKMFFWHLPSVFVGTCWDTMIANQVIYNGFEYVKHGLADLSNKLLGKPMSKEQRNTFIGKPDTEPFSVNEILYAAGDVIDLEELKYILLEKNELQGFGYERLFDEVEMPTVRVLAKMENKGFDFDKDKWASLAHKTQDLLQDTEIAMDTEINRLSGKYRKLISADLTKIRVFGPEYDPEEFNKYSSPELLIKIFSCCNELDNLTVREDLEQFTANKVEKKRKASAKKKAKLDAVFSDGTVIKQGTLFDVPVVNPNAEVKLHEMYSLGEEALKGYIRKDTEANFPLRNFVKLLLDWRKYSKQASTYGEAFLDILSTDGRARTSYRQCYTATGRLSSSSYRIKGTSKADEIREGYNAQNIPAILEMRHCFMADTGYKIATIDFSGQEICLAASQSEDEILIKSIMEGLDLHSYLAQPTFRLVKNDPNLIVSKDENVKLRTQHKPILFGAFYGAGASRIAALLDIPKDLATKAYERLRGSLPQFFAYQDKVQAFALKHRYIKDNSKYNRRKYFAKDSPDYRVTKQASNFPMQSSGASMVKEAMVKIEEYFEQFKEQYPLIGIIGQAHDELISQIPEDRYDIVEQVKLIMETVANSYVDKIKIQATVEWEPYWTK